MASTFRKRPRSPLAEPWGRMRVLNQIFRIPARGHFQAQGVGHAAPKHKFRTAFANTARNRPITEMPLICHVKVRTNIIPRLRVETKMISNVRRQSVLATDRELQAIVSVSHVHAAGPLFAFANCRAQTMKVVPEPCEYRLSGLTHFRYDWITHLLGPP